MDIELLKIAVTRLFGRPIINRPDCEELSRKIFETTHEHVSYNTLRRFYSLADRNKHQASRSTLTILARYLGFKNYPAFCAVAQNIDPLIRIQDFMVNIQFEAALNIKDVEQMIQKTTDLQLLSTLLPGIIFTAIKKNDIHFMSYFFELNSLFENRNYLNHEIYHVLLLFGVELRTFTKHREELWKYWSSNSRARSFYFEFFVDMDYLMVSHHKAIEFYLYNSNNNQDKIFAKSLLCWRSVFLEDNSETASWIEQLKIHFLDAKIHPIPRARLLNCLLVFYYLNNEKTEFARIIQMIKIEHKSRQNDLDPFFQYWIIEGLCIVGEFDFCLEIIDNIESHWSQVAQRFYNKGALTKTQMIKCRCLHKKGLKTKAKELFNKINTQDCFACSRIYDQIFLPSIFTEGIFSEIKNLKYDNLFYILNDK